MRRPLSIALASLFVAALVAPSAQAATRRYDFQANTLAQAGKFSVAVFYKNKQRHGRYTPRQAIYKAKAVPLGCDTPGSVVFSDSGSYIPGTPGYNYIKMRKGSFSYSYSSEIVEAEAPPQVASGHISATATGTVIKKKPGVSKLRVDASVSILDYDNPAAQPHPVFNCTSDGPVPYSATPCRQQKLHLPYIKKSLPLCVGLHTAPALAP